jgi:hypothetical protein
VYQDRYLNSSIGADVGGDGGVVWKRGRLPR